VILEKIESPQDLKTLNVKELKILGEEIRRLIIDQTELTGGHLASNLGVVELTLTLHKVFDSPKDKILWDVGHQCYTHKIITGRREQFATIRQKDGISGFPRIEESPHDAFDAGHASTSLAAALGYEWGQQLQGKTGHVIALIGDGSLTGGAALEALNFGGHLPNNLIVILNDNDMSISRNVGALASYLTRLSSTGPYVKFRRFWARFWNGIPLIGKGLYNLSERFKRALKGALIRNRLFSDLGYRYVGPLDGHNLHQLERVFLNLRDNPSGPVVVHVKTLKGKGHKEAENNPQNYHGVSPNPSAVNSMTSLFGKAMVKMGEKDSSIVAISAAMEGGTGLTSFRKAFPQRFLDVGITEPLAVTMAASMSLTGLKPVVAIYSTFMQRAVDQVIHDVALNSLPVLFVMDRAGLVPQDGQTHQGIFDIALFRSIPGAEMLAPVSAGDLEHSLEYGLAADHPVFIRLAKDKAIKDGGDQEEFIPGRGFFSEKGSSADEAPLLIISLGSLLDQAARAVEILEKENSSAHIYQLRWAFPLDWDYLLDVADSYELVLFLEEGMEQGGMGEAFGCALKERKSSTRFIHKGVPAMFPPAASRKELFKMLELDGKGIARTISETWENIRFEKVVDQVRKNGWKSRNL